MKHFLKYSHHVRIILKVVLYLLFIAIFYNLIASSNNLTASLLYTCVLIVVLSFNILYDYLKKLLQDMQKALVVDCDDTKVVLLRNKIRKIDFINGMKNDLILFDILHELDKNNPDAVLDLLSKNKKFMSGHLDYIFIRDHSEFKAYSLLNNKTRAREAFDKLDTLRETSQRTKNRQMGLLYNWDQIDALNYFVHNDFKKSLKTYLQTNTSKMNNRELIHYYYELGAVYKELKKENEFKTCMDYIKSINPFSPFLGDYK